MDDTTSGFISSDSSNGQQEAIYSHQNPQPADLSIDKSLNILMSSSANGLHAPFDWNSASNGIVIHSAPEVGGYPLTGSSVECMEYFSHANQRLLTFDDFQREGLLVNIPLEEVTGPDGPGSPLSYVCMGGYGTIYRGLWKVGGRVH